MDIKKFPFLKGKTTYFPQKAKCPWCNKNKVLEPHSFAAVSGGALLKNQEENYSGPSEDMEGYFNLTWHGAHEEEGGEGKDPNTWAVLDIARDVQGGQFDAYFCSTNCLRAFLNYCVDELERRVEQNKSHT